jgi:hypothetical protein
LPQGLSYHAFAATMRRVVPFAVEMMILTFLVVSNDDPSTAGDRLCPLMVSKVSPGSPDSKSPRS